MECERINRYIRRVLLAGMVLSVSTLLIGLTMYALSPGTWDHVTLSLPEILSGIAEGNPIAVIDLGIILLIATPLTRVVAATVLFAVNRETRFIYVGLAVLAVVGLAILLGA
jgi:uncharacterized membrane protein